MPDTPLFTDALDEMQRRPQYLFAHEKQRDVQLRMMDQLWDCITQQRDAIVHAPTGLGKTAGALVPALTYALQHKKKVFFLTSRHTQHAIAIDTARAIQRNNSVSFPVTDLIGKKWMCAQGGVEALSTKDFSEYCKRMREGNKCEYFLNTRDKGKVSVLAESELPRLKSCVMHIEDFTKDMRDHELCPYEMAGIIAQDAALIIADYNYIFNVALRQRFLARINAVIDDCIIVVDEAHNLPDRLRELMSESLSTHTLKRALKEAMQLGIEDVQRAVDILRTAFDHLGGALALGQEKVCARDDLLAGFARLGGVDVAIRRLDETAEIIREREKQSALGSIADFLRAWLGIDDGYVRVITKTRLFNEVHLQVRYACLDPSIMTKEVVHDAHSVILMSATLTPMGMYKDLLGFSDETVLAAYESPFPEENRLHLVVPDTTTKWTARSDTQYARMAQIIAQIVNAVPGNSAVFFPSYELRNLVFSHFNELCEKSILAESQNMSKQEKAEFIDEFKANAKIGAVLLGTISGSFGEGIDLPGDLLKCVIVVGLPLSQPTAETKALIDYYDLRFKRGWDYGYIYPAFSKTIQAAGRCIRTETDRGVIVFLDERYATDGYMRCFPSDWDVKITKLYADRIREFFTPSLS